MKKVSPIIGKTKPPALPENLFDPVDHLHQPDFLTELLYHIKNLLSIRIEKKPK